jgi:hypothetical protein
MFKSFWIGVVAWILCGALSGAQAADALQETTTELEPSAPRQAKPVESTTYWLGIECFRVAPALRAQLNLPEKQGLLVVAVVPASPAAKAGIVANDVLLRAADKPLTGPCDLVQALETAKTGKLKLDLLRGGKPQTVEAMPTKRPADAGRQPALSPNPADQDAMEKWLDGLWSGMGGDGPRPAFRFQFLHPGAIVPPDVLISTPLPPDMSIIVSKEGDQLVKIVVKRGDKKWEVTEKELDKLPADVRPHVERMLGHHLLGMVMPYGAPPPSGGQTPAPAASRGVTSPAESGVWERLERRVDERFNEMSQRMDQVMKQLDALQEPHGQQKPAER